MNFKIVKKAQMTQAELANLCDVSRVTANKWMTGTSGVHALLQKKVALILAAIEMAVEEKKLPVKPELDREQRVAVTRTVVARYVTQIKAK
jgi:transcriptional regulator with XRE-family HTH domain